MLDYLIANVSELAGLAAAFVLFFDRLAKMTPTTKDNAVVSKIYMLFAALGLKVKDNPGNGTDYS